MNNIMLDIETVGNGSNAAIISIGAVFFEPSTGELGKEFNMPIDLESSVNYGDIDASTIKWWFSQSQNAQKVFNVEAYGLETALKQFLMFLTEYCDDELTVCVWGNGCGFDNVILSNAYKAVKMVIPWKHWNDRDVRTIVDLGRTLKNINPKRDLEFIGTQHDALDDAKHQARYVSIIYQALSS